jgi:hypothetical protein
MRSASLGGFTSLAVLRFSLTGDIPCDGRPVPHARRLSVIVNGVM